MDRFFEIFHNPYLTVAMSSWFVAQVLKTIIHAILNGKLTWERLFGDGGMPSGHSATVSSLATLTGLVYGMDSFEFAVAAVLAIIVCHDAMGVRLETGKQAQIINEIVRTVELFSDKKWDDVKLKEFVGHSPVQVCAGVLVGILNALFMHYVVFGF